MSLASYTPSEHVALLQEESAHRFHVDPTFYARVNLVRRALEHTGLSERQIAWILMIDDRSKANMRLRRLTNHG